MKVICITQARMGSTRLPGKVLKEVNGDSLLKIHYDRIRKSKRVDQFILATSTEAIDNEIEKFANDNNIECFRGSEENVLDRFYQAAKQHNPDYVVRLTADCPLIDPVLIDKIIDFTITNELDYCSNTLDPSYPDGLDVEVFTFKALEKAKNEAKRTKDKEHVTPFIWVNSTYKGKDLFKSLNFSFSQDLSKLRLTVDAKEDFELIEILINKIGKDRPWTDYVNYIGQHPELIKINDKYIRNENF